MVPFVGRLRRFAIAPQVRADDGKVARQERSDPMPCCVRARMAMQKQDGWPRASMPHPKGHVTNLDEVECESWEHRLKLTVWPAR